MIYAIYDENKENKEWDRMYSEYDYRIRQKAIETIVLTLN